MHVFPCVDSALSSVAAVLSSSFIVQLCNSIIRFARCDLFDLSTFVVIFAAEIILCL